MEFTFLCTTNQAKVLIFEGAFDFQRNLIKSYKKGFEKLDKTKKKDFIVSKPKEDKGNALEYATKGDKCTELSEDMNLSRNFSLISESFKKINFYINEIVSKVKISKGWIGITKDS